MTTPQTYLHCSGDRIDISLQGGQLVTAAYGMGSVD